MSALVEITRGSEPLAVSIPHTGTDIPPEIEARLVSPWLARKDADWWIDRLYDFAAALGATVVRAKTSRTVIDVNRDPSGASLYPGQTTTGLCPTETFDGEPLYSRGSEPDQAEIARRRELYFDPYHAALAAEIARLREKHARIVVYDCHSIRSVVPRLFEGELPHMNIGTNSGASCGLELQQSIEAVCAASPFTWVSNGRFKGGWITRRYGAPAAGVHAVQMELACRSYMEEPRSVGHANWPTAYEGALAEPMRDLLRRILDECLNVGGRLAAGARSA
jgi:N-formylglutamate deformylase